MSSSQERLHQDERQEEAARSSFPSFAAGCFGCGGGGGSSNNSQAASPDGSSQRSRAESRREIRRLRSRLFEFINSKQQPRNYSMMVRYLLHWQVSVYSLVWTDMLLWIGLYTAVNVMYRHLLNPEQQATFVRLVHSVGVWQSNVPVTFLLGFYVSTVVDRWWRAYLDIPTMSTAALRIECAVFNLQNPNKAERIRLTLSRYLNLAWLLYMWKISEKIKQRFRILRSLVGETNRHAEKHPVDWGSVSSRHRATDGHLENSDHADAFHSRIGTNGRAYPVLQRIQSVREDVKQKQVDLLVQDLVLLNQDPVVQENYGEIITPSEIAVYEERARQAAGTYSIEYELPMHWAAAVAWQASREGFIHGYEGYDAMVRLLCDWSSLLGTISKYANKNLPLVYTQVVIIAVYTWFFIEVVASQNLIQAHVANMTSIGTAGALGPSDAASPQKHLPPHQPRAWYSMQYWTDFYVPVFALLKLLFVLGWFKVAFLLMDPYGDDIDGLPFSDVLNSNLRRGRVMAGFPSRLYPKKLLAAAQASRPAAAADYMYNCNDQQNQKQPPQPPAPPPDSVSASLNYMFEPDGHAVEDEPPDYLHSDEELTQELRSRRAGPWRVGGSGGSGHDGCRRCCQGERLPQDGDLP